MADDPQCSDKKQEDSNQDETPKNLIKVTVKTPKEKEIIEVDEEATVAQVFQHFMSSCGHLHIAFSLKSWLRRNLMLMWNNCA